MENTIDPQQLETFILQSNAIENVYGDKALKASLEAWDYLMAVGSQPFTLADILNTHKLVMLPLAPRIAGKIRTVVVYVGNRICPKPERLPELLDNLLTQYPLTNEADVKKWHIIFEKTHPFEDGNGRTGRLLMNAQRVQLGLPLLIIHKGLEQLEYYNWFRTDLTKVE